MATMIRAGRYEILGELGRGAMGVVYRATDPVIGRTVAVKTIHFGTVQQTTPVMCTPRSMSRQEVKGTPVVGRSDIFSIGVLLYELLTGEKSFPGQSITTVIYKIVTEEPIPPRTLNPSLH